MTTAPFVLPPLPLTAGEDRWPSFAMLEFRATAELSKLSGMMQASAKADLFWLMWLLKEAQSSNVIEGTLTTFDEILGENAGIVVPAERQDDVMEVINYRESMVEGIESITQGRPLTLSFIKSLHARLLHGARGEQKNPGEWRKIQVHIGRPHASLEDSSYIPPDPLHVSSLLENWELFIHREDLNPIVQAAIMHAQFEMIHPFCDGNGRMGRLLITLFFAEKKVISSPCFYMSAYLQEHRNEYYSSLGNISKNNDWESWIQFFLNAVIERSADNIKLLDAMNQLYEKSKQDFPQITGSSASIQILDYLFEKPLFTVPDMQRRPDLHLSAQGITNIVTKLEQAHVIEKLYPSRGRTPATWRFSSLVELLS